MEKESRYSFPKGTFEQKFTVSETALLFVLLWFQETYQRIQAVERKRWFYVSNQQIRKRLKITKRTIAKARESLRKKGLIDYKRGYTGRATEYRLI